MFGKVRYILFWATTLLKIKLIDTPVRERLCTINNTVTLTPGLLLLFFLIRSSPRTGRPAPTRATPTPAPPPHRCPLRRRLRIAECDRADGIRDVDILITTHKKQPVICTRGKVKRIIRSKNLHFLDGAIAILLSCYAPLYYCY